MIDVSSEQLIGRPLEEVFDFMAELDKLPLWLDGCKKAWSLSGDPRKVGSRVAHLDEFMGQTFEAEFHVLDWEDNKRMVFKAVKGPFRGTSEETFEDEGDGTRVTIRVTGEPAGFLKFAGWGVKRMAQSQIDRSLENAKRVLESTSNK